ncbi:MAG TPA: outer membrane protein assembly factor BamD, partial [Nitrospinaceae bacterium]|nr:outer membrane protein assembly factor BamD [Nitrospinaceae bacterium]
PKSQFLESAKAKQIECEFKLAQNVFEIGKFYYRTGSYQSAIIRLKNLVAEHPKHKHLDEAMFLIAESYYHEQSFDEASVSYKELLKRYPRSRFSIQAKSRLRTLRR